jgi:hypothetical protein
LDHGLHPYGLQDYPAFLDALIHLAWEVWPPLAESWRILSQDAQTYAMYLLLRAWDVAPGEPEAIPPVWDGTREKAFLVGKADQWEYHVEDARYHWDPRVDQTGYAFPRLQPGSMPGTLEAWTACCRARLLAQWTRETEAIGAMFDPDDIVGRILHYGEAPPEWDNDDQGVAW